MSGTKRQATTIATHADVAWRKLSDLRRDLAALADLIEDDNGEGNEMRAISTTLGLLVPHVIAEGTRWRGYADHR